MSTAALKHDALLPRPPGGNAPGAALALVVHVGLVAALTMGVDWRNREPEVVAAELWAAVPQTAAPPPAPAVVALPPPPPPPPPVARAETRPDADIAIEQERQRQRKAELERRQAAQTAQAAQAAEAERQHSAEQRNADDERKKREKREKREKQEADREADRGAKRAADEKADDERLARQRQDNLRRMIGQAGGTPGQPATSATTGTATKSASPSAGYAGLVRGRVKPNIVFTGSAAGDAAAEVEVTLAPAGTIISRRLVKSSGHKDFDEAVLRAIDKTPALPTDTDGRVPGRLIIAFRPNE